MAGRASGLDPYVPRVASDWDLYSPDSAWRVVDGTLVFVDISGFTNLSERLSRKGRIGAEELTVVLDKVFGDMLEIVFERGGSLLKFGGDALLLLFDSHDHVMQAVAATVEMRAALRQASKERTSVGRIDLKMSSGIHTGEIDFFLVGESHRELIVTGPVASHTTKMESTAEAGEIVVSEAVADQLPTGFVTNAKGSGFLMRKQKVDCPRCGPVLRETSHAPDLASFVPLRLRDHLSLGITDSEHRIASIGFIKFTGVDDLLAVDGPTKVADVLQRLLTTVQESVDDEGVTFLATDIDADGGKMILASGVPASQHDDEGRILRSLRRILDTPQELHLRAGVNRGHVFTGDVGTPFRRTFTVMGDTVNLAARLMSSAASGHLYGSPSVLDESSTLFRTEVLEPFQVKGKETLVQAYDVFEEIGTRPPDMTHELPFRGREPEMQMLVSIVTTCAQVGRGGMMTIVGDTGIGKSRLIAEVLERCPGLATLLIKAEPNGQFNPYWAFRDPLRRQLGIQRGDVRSMTRHLRAAVGKLGPHLTELIPLLGDILHIEVPDNATTKEIDPRFRPDRTADALIELLDELHDEPLAVIAEDGQWLDEASRNLVRRLGSASESRPWTTIVTMRDAPGVEVESFGDYMALAPLDDDEIRAIANEVTAAAPLRPHEMDRIVNRVGGNPLFLAEILSVIRETGDAENIPDSLDAVVSTQIDTLPALSRQTLRYASVLGTSFPTNVLREFLAPDEMEIDDATRTTLERFIEPDGDGRLRFNHVVVHDVAYRGLPYRRRRELHGRAGEVIEGLSSDDTSTSAEALAYHFYAAGRYDKAWDYSRVAATKAKDNYANVEAGIHYQMAVEAARHLPHVPNEDVCELWVSLSEVRELTGEMEAARDALTRARQAGDWDALKSADLLLRRAASWVSSGQTTSAKRTTAMARKQLNPQDRSHLAMLARLDALDASIRATDGDPGTAISFAAIAIERAEATDELEALARAYTVMDYANFMTGELEEWLSPKAIEIYEHLGTIERNVNVMNNLGAFAFWEHRWDDAVGWYQEAVEAADRSGNVVDGALARANIAEVLIAQRRPGQAGSLLDDALRISQSSSVDFIPLVMLLRARLDLFDGKVDNAIATLEELTAPNGIGRNTPWIEETLIELTLLHAQQGHPTKAQQFLTDPDLLSAVSTAAWLRAAGVTAWESGEVADGLALLHRAIDVARQDSDLYQELLALESVLAHTEHADPEQADRLLELCGRFGVHTTEAVST